MCKHKRRTCIVRHCLWCDLAWLWLHPDDSQCRMVHDIVFNRECLCEIIWGLILLLYQSYGSNCTTSCSCIQSCVTHRLWFSIKNCLAWPLESCNFEFGCTHIARSVYGFWWECWPRSYACKITYWHTNCSNWARWTSPRRLVIFVCLQQCLQCLVWCELHLCWVWHNWSNQCQMHRDLEFDNWARRRELDFGGGMWQAQLGQHFSILPIHLDQGF